jgi:hypothetical protein
VLGQIHLCSYTSMVQTRCTSCSIWMILSSPLLCRIIAALTAEFSMKDFHPLHHFLSVSVTPCNGGLFQYMLDNFDRAGMADCKPCSTPIDMCAKLSSSGTPVSNATPYQGLVKAL